ncbi:hypothetical protein [Desulfovibrio ferrophilus]|uniref:Uncharacterized protein n=1 Tax=Desulfovibrio ferrophilus TaxID=241368 RepID=A0A2Z6AZY3_9BACT|nr:hypothetical protein [Desulfovibrio ferrophilus]BBD08812.1 uncharacterized protein DFE_2086 [Desulfovibrio ferrophilus]
MRNHAKIGELYRGFDGYINKIYGFYLDSLVGFQAVRNTAEDYLDGLAVFADDDFDDYKELLSFSYRDILNDPIVENQLHTPNTGDVISRNAEDGANYIALGQMCLVMVYSYWDEYTRPEFAKAMGYINGDESGDEKRRIINNEVRYDFWGDIRYLRQSIVHCRGIANSDCAKLKRIKCFKPGDEIVITPRLMRRLFQVMVAHNNDLFKYSLPESPSIVLKS